METTIYETLSKKSSDELKAYITNMSDGYKQEAVKAAIAILKERGEKTDDLLRSARVEVCERCNNRKQSRGGLICGLTGKKADFICSCSSYSCDEAASAEQARVKNEKSGWGGMMSFYWFVLATGAVLTLIWGFVQFKPSEGLLLSLADLILNIAYSALCVYTIIAFSKRLPNAVTLGKMQNYTLIAINVLVLLFNAIGGGETELYGSSVRLIGSIIWAGIFLIYLYTNEQIKLVIPKESRHMLKYDKPIMWSIGGVILALMLAGFVEAAVGELNQPVNDLKSYVEEYQKTLAVDKTANSYCKGVEVGKDKVIVYQHSNTYTNTELADFAKDLMPVYSKEILFFYPETNKDLLEKCYAADYGFSISWYDVNDEYTYSIDLSNTDINHIFEDSIHVTSDETWAAFLTAWNKQFPAEYIGGSVYTSAEISQGTAIINLTLVDVPASELSHITSDYLKSYMQENFEDLRDHFVNLAMLNGMPICYSFSSDASTIWHKNAIFTQEELYYSE